MAAHVVTALGQEKESVLVAQLGYDDYRWDLLTHALSYAPWADNLDPEHWREIEDIAHNKNLELLQKWINKILPRYKEVWEYLGKPETCEEWRFKSGEKADVDTYEFIKHVKRILLPPHKVIRTINGNEV